MSDKNYAQPLEEGCARLAEDLEETRRQVESTYPLLLDQTQRDLMEDEVKETISSLRRCTVQLGQAMKEVYDLSDELDARYHDLERTEKPGRILRPAPANSMIDHRERVSNHFAQGTNLYKILWICFIGSFAGVVVELLWCLFRHGYLESRSGLVYGPFNLLYGAGAVALTLALYRYRNRGNLFSFLGGMAVGSVLEYVCSWAQETLLGSRSWDYSNMPFNINGRICLLYSVFWGFLGVLWIKSLYPRMAKAILKLPERGGRVLTWLITAFFVINAAVSCVSVYRWSQRVEGLPAPSPFWDFVDQRFPDARMERIFANMEFRPVGEDSPQGLFDGIS